MSRIQKKFKELKKLKKKALIVYITAGDPSLAQNEALIPVFEKDGVDLIELGVPFSDPLADGPVIQEASNRSLARKTTLTKILALVRRARKKSQIPILLMSYLNPILAYGLEAFAQDARAAGVDGLIIPDLPVEEGKEVSRVMRRNGLDLVFLLAPTSTPERVRKVAGASRGFLYYVSLTGVTGVQQGKAVWNPGEALRLAKRESKLPVCVGFGISTPEQAEQAAAFSDGVIVGSAIVKALAANPRLAPQDFSKRFIRPFAAVLKQ